jgi:hypothetical protein
MVFTSEKLKVPPSTKLSSVRISSIEKPSCRHRMMLPKVNMIVIMVRVIWILVTGWRQIIWDDSACSQHPNLLQQ